MFHAVVTGLRMLFFAQTVFLLVNRLFNRVVIVIFSDVLRYSEVEWPMRSWCLSE